MFLSDNNSESYVRKKDEDLEYIQVAFKSHEPRREEENFQV